MRCLNSDYPTMSTQQKNGKRRKYPSDMSENGWKKLKPYLPEAKSDKQKGGRQPVPLKEVINGILYVVKTGCSWRSMPHDLPHYSTVYGYFNRWSRSGLWQEIHSFLVKKVRQQMGRKSTPSAGSLDSQSVKTTSSGGRHRGFDAGKLIKGRKRLDLIHDIILAPFLPIPKAYF